MKRMNHVISLAAAVLAIAPFAVANPVVEGQPTWFVTPPIAARGQVVMLEFHNTTTDTVILANGGPWWIEVDGGNEVYRPYATQALVTLPPGGCLAWGWDQKGDDGNRVEAGSYVALIDWRFDGDETESTSTSPLLIAPGPCLDTTPPGVGEDMLIIELVNDTDDDLLIDVENPWEITYPDGSSAHLPPQVVLPEPIIIGPGYPHQIPIDLSDIGLVPGAYDVWFRFFENTLNDPRGLRDSSAWGGQGGAVFWRVTPPFNTVRGNVLLSLTNLTSDTVYISSTSPWSIYDSADEYVYSSAALCVIVPVLPGKTYAWSWGEQDWEGNWVGAGTYRASIATSVNDDMATSTTHDAFVTLVDPQDEGCCWRRSARRSTMRTATAWSIGT